jgi:hypothetical protein
VDQKQHKKQELEVRLERCRRLSREFQDGVTAKNLHELAEELERQIHELESQ